MLTGSIVALVTPMHRDGALDLHAFRSLIEWHLDRGTDGFVIGGTTGESPTLAADELGSLMREARGVIRDARPSSPEPEHMVRGRVSSSRNARARLERMPASW